MTYRPPFVQLYRRTSFSAISAFAVVTVPAAWRETREEGFDDMDGMGWPEWIEECRPGRPLPHPDRPQEEEDPFDITKKFTAPRRKTRRKKHG